MDFHHITIAKIRKWFLSGLIVLAPIVLTIYALVTVARIIDSIITSALAVFLPRAFLENMHGLGLILALIFVVAFGALMSNFLGVYFRKWGSSVVKRIPLVNSLYATIKQILDTILSNKSKDFGLVVLVEYPKKDSWVLAFVTAESDFFEEQVGNKESILHVFVPTTPNPTSGFMLIVGKSQVRETSLTTQEAMKIIVSAGAMDVRTPKKKISKAKSKEESEEQNQNS